MQENLHHQVELIQQKVLSLLALVAPKRAHTEVRKLSGDLQSHFQTLVQIVGEIHISAEQEVQKWRSLYKNLKSKKKAKLEQSWQELTNVYDKNHTQMNVFMDEIEIAVHELTHAREKMNIKHLGTMTNVEQEMERLCELALKSSRSQQSMQSQATASKQPSTQAKSAHKHSYSHHSSAGSPVRQIQKSKSSMVVPPLPIHKIGQQQAKQVSHRKTQSQN